MPEIDFDPMHKRASDTLEFDRLKLKKDERARIVLLEKPTFAFVHTLRAPKLVNGQAVKVEKESRKGGTYVDYDMDFVGRPLCAGDLGILSDSGVDPKNCPACARSTKTDEIGAPERRFAMNVIRYGQTRDGSLIKPFKCDCLVWGFTEGVFNRLINIAEEHGSLVGRDLILGPCTNEGFQKYEIQAGAQSLWQSTEEVKATVVATYQQNRVVELERACGRKAEIKWMIKDLDSISERWKMARGESDGTVAAGGIGNLDEGLANLLNTTPTATAKQEPVDMAGLLNFSGDTAPAEPAEPVNAGKVEAKPVSGENFDFGSILDGLN